MAQEAFVSVLEADLRALSAEARKSEGLAGQLAGWLSNSEHPEVKESAERALLKLRACARQADSLEVLQGSKEILRPFALACETKSSKLVSLALGCIQKMLANEAFSDEGRATVVTVLQHVEKNSDEGVKLKMLQTALTLLQNPSSADSEEDVCQVLGLCFRSLANLRNTETVISTAAATVRQAVAVVFDRALPMDPSPQGDSTIGDVARHLSNAEATVSGQTKAAIHLLEDLCQLASGEQSKAMQEFPPETTLEMTCFICSPVGSHTTWMQSPVIGREFILRVLQFIMSHNPEIFRTNPHFEEALRERVCHVLFQLLYGIIIGEGESIRVPEARAIFKTTGTLLSNFYMLIPAKQAQFLSLLLQGLNISGPLWRRLCCMHVLRDIASEPQHLYYLFVTYDMKLDYQLNAWHDLIVIGETIVQKFLKVSMTEDADGSSMIALTALFKLRGGQASWSAEEDIGSGEVVMAVLALDVLLKVVRAVEVLTEAANNSGTQDSLTPRTAVDGSLLVQQHICVLMVDDSWRKLLGAFQAVIHQGCGEFLVLQLLKGYQSVLQACASLQVVSALNAFLTSLCDLGLPLTVKTVKPQGSQRGGSTVTNSPGAAVLTPVNMQALRILFNVVHQLGNSLGSAWVLVVGALNSLDQTLQSPQTTTQEVALVHEVPVSGQRSELSILETSMDWLFESSKMLNTDAVVCLLSALRDVSCQSIPAASSGIGATKFALKRMADVLLENLHRIHDLWGVFLTHIIEIINSTTKECRAEAVLALDRAVTGAVGERGNHGKEIEVGDGDGDGGGSVSPIMDTAVENMLLVALESLYRDVSDQDAQKGILLIALHVLQRHGESLTRGWIPILRMLEAVPMTGDPELIVAGYDSIELVINDYLSLVPPELQAKCLDVASSYGNQSVALNVSLSAVSLLWSATDQLGKSGGVRHTDTSTSDSRTRPGRAVIVSNTDTKLSSSSLLFSVFRLLQTLSLDRRPEVRNSGIRTYFGVLASNASHLSLEAWATCVEDSILPLLTSVYHISATSSSEEAKPTVLGRDQGGKSVEMIVHHSRNSERKQWDESLVLTFNGLTKVLRSSLPSLIQLTDFFEAWRKIILICKASIEKGTREAATAGIALLTAVVQDHVIPGVISPGMLACIFENLDEAVTTVAHPESTCVTAVRLELVRAVGIFCTVLKGCLSVADLEMLLGWLDRLARSPFDANDIAGQVPGCLPNVQKEVLMTFSTLMLVENTEIRVATIKALCAFLYPPSQHVPSLICLPSQSTVETTTRAMSAVWMEGVIDELLKAYKDSLSVKLRGMVFNDLVASITRCMVTVHECDEHPLWRSAVHAFNAVVAAGLPAVNAAYASRELPPVSSWKVLAGCFEAFLLGRNVTYDEPEDSFLGRSSMFSNLSSNPGDSLTDSEIRTSVLDTLTDVVLMSCEHATSEMKRELIQVVDDGVELPEDNAVASSGRFDHACLRKMYVLCSRGTTVGNSTCLLEVAQLALPMFLSRCNSTLIEFVELDLRKEGVQLPGPLVDKVVFVLDILRSLATSPAVIDPTLRKNPMVLRITQSIRNGPVPGRLHTHSSSDGALAFSNASTAQFELQERSHLLLLYGTLVSCIPTKEVKVRGMVGELLQIIGEYLGICIGTTGF